MSVLATGAAFVRSALSVPVSNSWMARRLRVASRERSVRKGMVAVVDVVAAVAVAASLCCRHVSSSCAVRGGASLIALWLGVTASDGRHCAGRDCH